MPFTLVTVIWSSVTLDWLGEAIGARFQERASFSTKFDLDGGSASKKFIDCGGLPWETLGGDGLLAASGSSQQADPPIPQLLPPPAVGLLAYKE